MCQVRLRLKKREKYDGKRIDAVVSRRCPAMQGDQKECKAPKGCPLAVFQLVQLLVKIGNMVDTLTPLRQHLVQ